MSSKKKVLLVQLILFLVTLYCWRLLAPAGFALSLASALRHRQRPPVLAGRYVPAQTGAHGSARISGGTLTLFGEGSGGGASNMPPDWREFRARLVQQETEQGQSSDQGPQEGWVHETPIIEQGSLVISAGGDHFALMQQYLHKALVFIIQHNEDGDLGLILNRPTAFTMDDVDLRPTGGALADGATWNVWFGGDCQGIIDRSSDMLPFCLHTSELLSEYSQPVIKGVFLIDFAQAKELVAHGIADRDDFLLLLGYCAWMPGHLQSEVDRGNTWCLAAADQRMLLGELREAQSSLRTRLETAKARSREGMAPLNAADVGNGIKRWELLFMALGLQNRERWAAAYGSADDQHVDEMLNLWVERYLVPRTLQTSVGLPAVAIATAPAKGGVLETLTAGTILRGSATAWLLGKPAEDLEFSHFRPTSWRPHQYLHKAVMLLLDDLREEERSTLVILNGPRLRQRHSDGAEILLGGTRELGIGKVLELDTGGNPLRVEGFVSFRPGILEKLVLLNALQVAEGVNLTVLASTPKSARWEASGGIVGSPQERWLAALGDIQWRRWYRRFFGREMTTED